MTGEEVDAGWQKGLSNLLIACEVLPRPLRKQAQQPHPISPGFFAENYLLHRHERQLLPSDTGVCTQPLLHQPRRRVKCGYVIPGT